MCRSWQHWDDMGILHLLLEETISLNRQKRYLSCFNILGLGGKSAVERETDKDADRQKHKRMQPFTKQNKLMKMVMAIPHAHHWQENDPLSTERDNYTYTSGENKLVLTEICF